MSPKFLSFSKALVLCGIFVIIGVNLYNSETGFSIQNTVGIASTFFFGGLAAFATYKGIKQLIYTKQSA